MIAKKVDDLIADVVALDNTPQSQTTFSDQQIAKFMDEEMRGAIVPLVVRLREEYFVIVAPYAVDSTTTRITIPAQAAGFRLRDIYLYDANTGNFACKVNRINPDQIPYLYGSSVTLGFNQVPTYYIENNDIIFYPRLQQSYTAKIRYFKAPNHLYTYASCTAQVTAKLGANQVQCDNVPTGSTAVQDWSLFTGVNGTTLDIITPQSPYNFRMSVTTGLPLVAQAIVAVPGGNVVTLTSDAYNSLQAGDYLCTNDTCAFVQFLPFEAYELIKLRASMRILKAQGDPQNLGITAQLYNAAADDLASLLAPKVENMPKKVQPRSLLGSGATRKFR